MQWLARLPAGWSLPSCPVGGRGWRVCVRGGRGLCSELPGPVGLQALPHQSAGHWLGSLPGPGLSAVQQEGRAVGSAPLAWAVGSEAAQSLWLCAAFATRSAGLFAWLSAWTDCKLCSMPFRHQWPDFLEGWDWGLCLAVGQSYEFVSLPKQGHRMGSTLVLPVGLISKLDKS